MVFPKIFAKTCVRRSISRGRLKIFAVFPKNVLLFSQTLKESGDFRENETVRTIQAKIYAKM